MADLVWLHEGALRRSHPVFAAAEHGAPAVFIWDDKEAGSLACRTETPAVHL